MSRLSQKTEPFAAVLAAWIQTKRVTAAEAATVLGVSHQTVYNWLAGALPPRTRVPALALTLGVPVARLMRVTGHGAKASTDADVPQAVRP